MRQRQPEALDVRAIFSAAHEAANDPTSPWKRDWNDIITAAFMPNDWHTRQPEGRYLWHASALGSCPRRQVLKRAGLDSDGTRVESMNTLAIGTLYHALAEMGMRVLSKQDDAPYQNVRTEIGGYHPTLNLAARADLVYEHKDITAVVDWKTEAPYGATMRRKDAAKRDDTCSAKLEHIVQLTATAMVLEALGIVPERIDYGWIVYVEKSSGEIDQQMVALTDEARETVEMGVQALDYAWQQWAANDESTPLGHARTLPPRLGAGHWMCAPRSDKDERGKWCSSRTACFSLPPPLENP